MSSDSPYLLTDAADAVTLGAGSALDAAARAALGVRVAGAVLGAAGALRVGEPGEKRT